MNALLVGLLLSASPTTLAALDLEAQQVPAAVAKLVGTHLVVKLTQKGFQVLTASDLAAVIGVERQKQLLGCNEETNCLAEIGAALNAKGVVLGSVGRLGQTRLLNVKVIASGSAQSLAVCSGRAGSDEGLLAEAEACADTIAAALRSSASEPLAVASKPTPEPVKQEPAKAAPTAPAVENTEPIAAVVKEAPPRRYWALAPMIVGVLAAGFGVFLIAAINVNVSTIEDQSPPEALRYLKSVEPIGTLGGLALGAGIAMAAAGTVLFLMPPAPVQPVAMVTPQGGYLGVNMVFP
jgi:hypothetical protein